MHIYLVAKLLITKILYLHKQRETTIHSKTLTIMALVNYIYGYYCTLRRYI